MARALDVNLYGTHIGVVSQDDFGRQAFEYDSQYAADASRPPLSLSMPVSGARYSAKRIAPFMWGLLPDDPGVRARWAATFGVSAQNPFALLSHMGRDCAGGARFVPRGAEPQTGVATPLDDVEIGARLASLRSASSDWTVAGENWSLAGAQSKFTLTRDASGAWLEVSGDAPSTHILKPGISEYPQQALVEHISMRAAAVVGLRVAKTEFREFDGEPALVITRFDRRRARDGSVIRVHQEDMCQALAVYPARKYEGSGGPSAAHIARVLRDNATDPVSDVWEFAQALVFNYLIGAPDAHGKNYSVMHAPGLTRITPLYDMASALPYDAPDGSEIHRAAMSIGGKRVFGEVHGRHWDRLARQMGVEPERLRDEVLRQAALIPLAVFHEHEGFDAEELNERWVPRLRRLCDTTVTQLND